MLTFLIISVLTNISLNQIKENGEKEDCIASISSGGGQCVSLKNQHQNHEFLTLNIDHKESTSISKKNKQVLSIHLAKQVIFFNYDSTKNSYKKNV